MKIRVTFEIEISEATIHLDYGGVFAEERIRLLKGEHIGEFHDETLRLMAWDYACGKDRGFVPDKHEMRVELVK